jgi:tetratricopeptide (TPR) repeat protein
MPDGLPKSYKIYYNRGHTKYKRGLAHKNQNDIQSAINDFDRAIAAKSNYPSAYVMRGLAKRQLDRISEAIQDYSTAIQQDPERARAYNNRGYAYYLNGQHQEALDDFNEALKLRYVYAHALAGMAVTSFIMKDRKRALLMAKALLDIDRHYQRLDWTANHLNWPDQVKEDARLLWELL